MVAVLTFDGFRFRVERGWIGNFVGRAVIILFIHRKDRKLATAESVNAVMRSNGEQPRCKRAALVITMQVLISAQKRLLRGIFGSFGFAQHAIAQVKDVRLMFFDELGKRLVTALLSLENPDKFVVHSRSLYL